MINLYPIGLCLGSKLMVVTVKTPSIYAQKTAPCLRVVRFLAPQVGLEPTTLRLTAACSTD
jgi:hypothetical protein